MSRPVARSYRVPPARHRRTISARRPVGPQKSCSHARVTGNTPPIPADSATRSCTKRRRHQAQPRRRRESWLPYVMHLAAAPRRSSNQTRNQRHRRLFSYLGRSLVYPISTGATVLLFSPAGTLTTLKRGSFPAFHAYFC